MEILVPIIEKLAFPYPTCGGVQLAVNLNLFLEELEKQGIKLKINYGDKISKYNQVLEQRERIEKKKEEMSTLRCKKCGTKIKRRLFGKMQLCNRCHAD